MSLARLPMSIMQKLVPGRIWALEDALAARTGTVRAVEDAPERFEIVAEALRRGYRPPPSLRAMPHMVASIRGILRSLRSVDRNPPRPRTQMTAGELAALEAHARALGVDDVGYARLAPHLVFRDKAVLYPHAIVLTMEMDKAAIDTSPGEASYVEVHKTYHHLGRVANGLAQWLRARGYAAHAGHPLMGLALYPPLAQQAGLGWCGMHGLLITPRFGPRVRLAAVFTSIENLPPPPENPHAWIEDYCRLCRRCARECPPRAVLDEPLLGANGLVTCIDVERCFPYFVEQYGCSICIRVCPFQQHDYAGLKRHVCP